MISVGPEYYPALTQLPASDKDFHKKTGALGYQIVENAKEGEIQNEMSGSLLHMLF